MAKIKNKQNGTKKEAVVEAAAQLFYKKGYNATSMRDLAELLGVEAASLYNHINSKLDILHDICFEVATLFMSHIEEVDKSEKRVIDKVEGLLRFHIREMVYHHENVYVSDREWKHLTEPYLTEYQEIRRTYRKRFASIIEEGITRKE